MGQRLLLTTVFKPFACDDMFSRKENIPELMMSQITRVQGIFSYRAWHASAGLHLIGANCGCDTTVLEWPSLQEFEQILRQTCYDFVGISFIPSTVAKMRAMVKTVRKVSPMSRILIGGHGVLIPDLEQIVDIDYICRGEGIRFIRNLLGKSPSFDFGHPVVSSVLCEYLGVPIPFRQTGEIVPGLGCSYGCEFCVTSAFFDCVYQPFLSTGNEVWELLKFQHRSAHLRNFWMIDENFLHNRDRAHQFLNAIGDDGTDLPDISIDMIWSTSDCVMAFSPVQLAQMGITRIWMGYESMFSAYHKNSGTDFKTLIGDLADYGISVVLSCTAFGDFHDEVKWDEEVNSFVQLGQAYSQFLPLTAFPGTPLYRKMAQAGRLVEGIPYEERHALTTSFHRHPSIPLWKQERLILDAYKKEFQYNGPGQLRDVEIRARGCTTMRNSGDSILKQWAAYIERQLTHQASWVIASRSLAEEQGHGKMADRVIASIGEAIGSRAIKDAAGKAIFFERMIRRGLKERQGAAVSQREPGLRVTRYDGEHAEPVSVCNPEVW